MVTTLASFPRTSKSLGLGEVGISLSMSCDAVSRESVSSSGRGAGLFFEGSLSLLPLRGRDEGAEIRGGMEGDSV